MAEVQGQQKQEKTGSSCVVNRLINLKSDIEQEVKMELKAKDSFDFKDLENILVNIKQVLKNNPTQDEINSGYLAA